MFLCRKVYDALIIDKKKAPTFHYLCGNTGFRTFAFEFQMSVEFIPFSIRLDYCGISFLLAQGKQIQL